MAPKTKTSASPKRAPKPKANSSKANGSRANGSRAAGAKPGNSSSSNQYYSMERLKGLLSAHKQDIIGMFLVLAGIVSIMSVFFGSVAGLGAFIRLSLGTVFGIARFIAVIAIVFIGLRILFSGVGKAEKNTAEENEAEPHKLPAGSAYLGGIVGTAMIVISICGMLHLTRGRPDFTSDASEKFEAAGGVVGGVFAIPIETLVGVTVAGLILVVIGILGLSFATHTSFRMLLALAGKALTRRRRAKLGYAGDFSHSPDISEPGFAEPDEVPGVSAEDFEEGPNEWIAYEQTNSHAGVMDPLLSGKGSADGNPVQPEPSPEIPEAQPASGPTAQEIEDALAKDGNKEETKEFSFNSEFAKPIDPLAQTQAQPAKKPPKLSNRWKLPKLSLLARSAPAKVQTAVLKERGQVLEKALATHGVVTRVIGMLRGPTVTRYELELGHGIKVARLTSLNKDIAYAMASQDVRILAPIPGRQAIGIEVPNLERAVVCLGDTLSSREAKAVVHPLEVALGQDINNKTIMLNLAEMPHLLIAGATGAGKSSCLNSIVTSILMRTTPDQVRLLLIDPKMVEMRQFEQMPHLLAEPVVDPKKAANALGWAAREMDSRYNLLFRAGFRDITGYNAAYDKGELPQPDPDDPDSEEEFPRLSFIVIVVDELSDLMMVAAREVEDYICRLAQKARAVGIHLVVATQRPSIDVITGVIKANIPARLAFSVSSLTDSRVILDQPGAERLVGQGDMLLSLPTTGTLTRIQGAWISEEEVRRVSNHWKAQGDGLPDYVEDLTVEAAPQFGLPGGLTGSQDDELLEVARELVISSGLGSTSMLQRKLRVGFARAGRLMDLLEEQGVVGPSEGSKAREVLIMSETELS